ncbi:MAG: translation initiation factor IF-2 [Bacteroidetes bacterium]|nr:translation initiation factor IF-2 [Bacteroidota bacterium]
MTEGPQVWRLSKAAKEFNIGINTVVDFLSKKGFKIDNNPNTKIPAEAFDMLVKEFQGEKKLKEAVLKTGLNIAKRETISLEEEKKQLTEELKSKETTVAKEEPLADEKDLFIKDNKSSLVETTPEIAPIPEKEKIAEPKILGKIDLSKIQKDDSKKGKEARKEEAKKEKEAAEAKAKKETKAKEQEEIKVETEPEVKTELKTEEKPVEKVEKQTEQVEKVVEAAKPEVKPEEKEVAPEIVEPVKAKEPETNILKVEFKKLEGVTILGKIDLPVEKEFSKKPVASSSDPNKSKKRKRKRIRKEKGEESTTTAAANTNANATANKESQPKTDNQQEQADKHKKGGKKGHVKKVFIKPEVSEEEISRQIKETLATLSGTGKSKASKYRRQKRDHVQLQREKEFEQSELEKKVLQVTEFIPASELAKMMNVNVNEIISTCMSIGLFISINQRLDAETISIVAEEFGYEVKFVSVDDQESIKEEKDKPEDLLPRAPIVTVMGHVDHGKTSLLDQIRKSNIIAGEAGGITQHIGAYVVELDDQRKITFLDTPGHEAFTAMRARGARVTDVAIIVVAADDSVMPQTIEAINHAQAANVPIVIAINKIDKPGANVEKVKEELAKINVLVEDWGGKYQSQEISAKNGINIDLLLDKVLLEAELLDLKANPNKNAVGTVIEASLDKGRGYLATILVQAGTLKLGDIVVAGTAHGKIKAMFNERNVRISTAGPSTPAVLLGLDCAPQAGDTFNVVDDEHEARSYTTKRQQIIREQGLRTHKHITLDEIGRRIAIGDFKELNIIVKGDVDGSVEALGDALLKLSTEEVQVNIIHKAVGQITEGDVLLATASNAIIVGFQVRPSLAARKLAEHEQIDIRLYSIIYNAINEIKSAIEGMLSPDIEEKIIANIEIRETFKITKVGTVAGCMVLDGKINRNSTIRVIRDGIVTYTGRLGSLKRFKDDVKEVSVGYECGLNIDRFNDIKVGDIIEAFETIEIARKL